MQWVELNWLEDAKLLARLGRGSLAGVLDMLAPALAERGLTLPDPTLPDRRYLAEVAAVVRHLPLRLTAYVLPFDPAGSRSPNEDALTPATATVERHAARYALRRDGNLWHLTVNGRDGVLRHEQGLYYVAEMLSRPRERVKKLDLAAKYSRSKSEGGSHMEVYDPATGTSLPPDSTESVHEASLASDENGARNACRKRALELKATIDDATETDAAKADAREGLEQIAAYLRKDHRVSRDSTKAAGDAIRNAFKKLLRNLVETGDSATGRPSVQQELAEHIHRYLATPSRRYSAPGARKARGELTGCLLYEPPEGVAWIVSQ